MAEKTLKTRIIHKHETEADWSQATGFTPKEAELIVYDKDDTHAAPRVKIGDGETNVNNLPFVNNIESGSGINSVQQSPEVDSWTTSNDQVIQYIDEQVGTADDGHTIQADGYTIKVGAFGKSSESFGGKSQSLGKKSHTEGSKNIAFESNAHAEGNETFAAGKHSHAEGNHTSALANFSHAEGSASIASGEASHAEGTYTSASGFHSHAEGGATFAKGEFSHAEGNYAVAEGEASHAEGAHTSASGFGSHAEGAGTSASGLRSHAEGEGSKAYGDYSHAGGYYTIAGGNYQTAIGKFNIQDAEDKYAFIIGAGDSNDIRNNAYTLDWNGNGVYAGGVTADKIVTNSITYDSEYSGSITIDSSGIKLYPYVGAGFSYDFNGNSFKVDNTISVSLGSPTTPWSTVYAKDYVAIEEDGTQTKLATKSEIDAIEETLTTKSNQLTEGENIQFIPNEDGTIRISAIGGFNTDLNDLSVIASGELTEAVQKFTISQDAGGSTFTIRDFFYVFVEAPPAEVAANLRLWTDADNTVVYISNGLKTDQTRVNKIVGFYTGFDWEYITQNNLLNQQTGSALMSSFEPLQHGNAISQFTIGCMNSGETLPIGTKYLICGRKV